MLDHFQGNRTPYTDPHSRGAITGLSLNHQPGHVFRAMIEGICLGTRLVVDNFGDHFQSRRVVIAGGATNSPLWLQIHADTLNVPIERTSVPEAPLLGCAILAAKGAGRFSTIEEGCSAMVKTTRKPSSPTCRCCRLPMNPFMSATKNSMAHSNPCDSPNLPLGTSGLPWPVHPTVSGLSGGLMR